MAVVALLLSLQPRDSILNLVGNAWAGFGAAFGPLILLSLLYKKSSKAGALSGMLVGGFTVLIWIYFDHPFKDWYELIPGFTLSFITHIIVSKFTYKPNIVIDGEFDEVDKMKKEMMK